MRVKTKNTILAVATTVAAISLPAILTGKYFESVFFFFCHWLIREQFPKQYHSVIPSTCRTITSVVFFFGVMFILPFSFSFIFAIPINYFISWVGFVKKDRDDLEYQLEKLKSSLEKDKTFSTKNCTKEELIARCKEIGMKQENIDIAIELFVERKSRKELAEKHYLTEDAIKKKKQRLKDKLNNN